MKFIGFCIWYWRIVFVHFNSFDIDQEWVDRSIITEDTKIQTNEVEATTRHQ